VTRWPGENSARYLAMLSFPFVPGFFAILCLVFLRYPPLRLVMVSAFRLSGEESQRLKRLRPRPRRKSPQRVGRFAENIRHSGEATRNSHDTLAGISRFPAWPSGTLLVSSPALDERQALEHRAGLLQSCLPIGRNRRAEEILRERRMPGCQRPPQEVQVHRLVLGLRRVVSQAEVDEVQPLPDEEHVRGGEVAMDDVVLVQLRHERAELFREGVPVAAPVEQVPDLLDGRAIPCESRPPCRPLPAAPETGSPGDAASQGFRPPASSLWNGVARRCPDGGSASPS